MVKVRVGSKVHAVEEVESFMSGKRDSESTSIADFSESIVAFSSGYMTVVW